MSEKIAFELKILGVDKQISSIKKLEDSLLSLSKAKKELAAKEKAAAAAAKLLVKAQKAQQSAVESLARQRQKGLAVMAKEESNQRKLTSAKYLAEQAVKKEKAAAAALDKQRQKGLALMAKVEAKEREFKAALNLVVKSEDDLMRKTNALVKSRRLLNTTTEAGKRKHKELTLEINKNTNALKRSDAQIGRNSRKVGNYTGAIKRAALSIGGALGLTAGLAGLFRAFGDIVSRIRAFDKEMQNMAGISGTSRDELKAVETTIREIASSSIKTSNEVAQLATTLFTLGKTKNEVILMLKPVNDLSIALGSTSAETADFLGQTLNAFGKGAGSAEEFADIIANVRGSTSLDFERIRDALGFVAPTANALNLSLGETSAVLGVLQDNGVKASRAGALLNTSFARLVNKGLTLDEALVKINGSTNKVKTASELFGARSFSLGLILADNVDKTARLANEFDNLSDGSLKKLTDEQLKALESQFKILDSTWENFVLGLDSGTGIISTSLRGVISTTIEFIDLLDAAGKSFAQIVIESSNSQLAENLKQDRQEVELMAKSLEEKGVESVDANKRAVELLILQYIRLKETAAEPASVQKQIDALREMRQKIADDEVKFVEEQAATATATATATAEATKEVRIKSELNTRKSIDEAIAAYEAEKVDLDDEIDLEEDDEEFPPEIMAQMAIVDFARQSEEETTEFKAEQLAIRQAQLEAALKMGIITEAQYAAASNVIATGSADAKTKIEELLGSDAVRIADATFNATMAIADRDSAAFKAAAIGKAIIGTSLGIIGALDEQPAWLGIALAAIIGATGALNIAKIAGVQFEEGGLINGSSHKDGGVPFSIGGQQGFEAEGGEVMFSNKAADYWGRSRLLDMNMQGNKFESGGFVASTSQRTQEISDESVERLINGINDKQVINDPVESLQAQNDSIFIQNNGDI